MAALALFTSTSPGLEVFAGGTLAALALILAAEALGVGRHLLSFTVRPEIVLLTTTVVLCLVGAEIALRLFFFQMFPDFRRMNHETLAYQYDRALGWSPKPNERKTAMAGKSGLSISNNSVGFRDVEFVTDNRPGLICLGDSFVWGYNVEASERFTDKLQSRHPEWHVFNFGVVGYGNDQEYLLLRKYFEQYRPRVVFLVVCVENDHIDNCSNSGGRLAFKPYFKLGSKGLELHGSPVPLSDYQFCARHPLISKPYLSRLVMKVWGNLRCPPRGSGKDPTTAILQAIHDYVTAHGAAFAVGITGRDQEVEDFLQRAGIQFLDLTTNLRTPGGWHWSPEGHTYVADRIESFLLSHHYLDRPPEHAEITARAGPPHASQP